MSDKASLIDEKNANDKRLDKCERLLFEIDSLIEQNKGTINVGIFDVVAGGFFTSLHKKSKINKVKSNLLEVKYLLQEYIAIANDASLLKNDGKLDLPISDILLDVDVWFDNFISDIIVNNRLENLMVQLSSLKNDINNEFMRLKSLDLYYRENL
ncbi:MAG: hypothetical protein ACRC6T_08585 [Sarcina sp.]